MRFSMSLPSFSDERPAASEPAREREGALGVAPPSERPAAAQPLPDDLDERVRLVGEW